MYVNNSKTLEDVSITWVQLFVRYKIGETSSHLKHLSLELISHSYRIFSDGIFS